MQRYFRRVGENPLKDLMVCTRELYRHYIPSRYPNALPSGILHEAYDEKTSRRAIEVSEKVVNFVRKIIGV